MEFKDLIKESQRPEPYKLGTSVMWTDTYISQQLLKFHLNPEVDAASRNPRDIKQTVEWILRQASQKNMKILDLGCGPGLYTEEFAKKGHQVTGMDFSKNSLNYAESQKKRKKLNITYLHQNYLEMNFKEKFDLIVMIYTDFGVLHPDEQIILLKKIRNALKENGIFIFDVVNDKNLDQKILPESWDIHEAGFWKPYPYIALFNSFHYSDIKVILNQHLIIDKDNNYDIFRFWIHYFSENDMISQLRKNSFHFIKSSNDVLAPGNAWSGENITFYSVLKK